MSMAVEATGSESSEPQRLRRGTMLGRYIVLEELGTGGMGVVYKAYDPRLGREVALKCVKTGKGSVAASSRLFREAQAMARLTHPNVLPVYDVDRIDGDVVMSMEFVPGKTLHEWFATKPKWQRVLEVMMDAGRGLQAAHAAELVHRDFKPANVLVGADGRVRVMDFGLARVDLSASSEAGEVSEASDPDDALASPLTRAGTVMGTPPYMAPEQHEGEHAGSRSDQYSFCLTLYEGLWGRRPFEGSDPRFLQTQRLKGPPPPPKKSPVPAHLFAVVRRGLEVDPAARYPSMAALLHELAPPSSKRALWVSGSLVLAIGAAATVVVASGGEEPCESAGATVASTWDEPQREALHASLTAERKAYGESTWERVETALDDYAGELRGAYQDACLATHRGEQSAALLDARTHCLEQRRRELAAMLEVFVDDASVADKAIDAVSDLPPTDVCADPDYTRGPTAAPTDPELREAVQTVRGSLASVRGLGRAGRYGDALSAAEVAFAEAEKAGHLPAVVEARAELGLAAVKADKLDVAERELQEAYYAAGTIEHDDVGVDTSLALARLIGHEFNRADEGAVWMRHARMLVEKRPDDVRSRSRVLIAQATLDVSQGRYADGADGYREARKLLTDTFGETHPEAASLLRSVAIAESALGHFDSARILSEQAVEQIRVAYGPEHPFVPDAMRRLASILVDQGDLSGGLSWAQRALEIEIRVMGPRSRNAASTKNLIGTIHSRRGDVQQSADYFQTAFDINRELLGDSHHDTIGIRINLAGSLLGLGRLEEAEAQARAGFEGLTAKLGPDHPSIAKACNALALVLEATGELDEALALHKQMHGIMVKAHGEEHINIAGALFNIGRVLVMLHRYEEAIPHLRNASTQWERALGVSHPQTALTHGALGEALLGAGKPDEALTFLEPAARVLRGTKDVSPNEIASVQFSYAKALWSDKARRDESRAAARKAADMAVGPTKEAIEGFIASH